MNKYDKWFEENRKQNEQDFVDGLEEQFNEYCKSIYEPKKGNVK